ncbi:MAG: primosomal protein N' [Dehalococcoidales bacterium]|nr:primosomal protein N' [Dehalococcoidales bacterium]
MSYAEVSVNSPIPQRQIFSYAIPKGLDIHVGQAVWVPFGNKILQGIVIKLNPLPSVEQTRDITGAVEPPLILSPQQLELARWMSDYYMCPLFDSLSTMLPPGFERKTITFISLAKDIEQHDLSQLPPQQKKLIELIKKNGKINLKDLEKVLGKKNVQISVAQLVAHNLIIKRYETEPVRVKPRKESFLSLKIDAGTAQKEISNLFAKRAEKQATLLELLIQSGTISSAEARKDTGCQPETIKSLANKGFICIEEVEVKRQPVSYKNFKKSEPLKLTGQQDNSLKRIKEALSGNSSHVFLLHGVTGSGKTEIYLQALAEAVKHGKRGIVLVPEISMTPQTLERFANRFPYRVAVIHSQLSLGEQFDQWRQIQDGAFDVVIGPRSAIFAPQPDLGLIVIDEEHEWTYKQDNSPRYHTRDVALKIAGLNKAVVILGSATPDVATYYHAQQGIYRLLELPQRVAPSEGAPLPRVEIVDLREELKAGNTGVFSRLLRSEIDKALAGKEQVILFFNRRGSATFVQCRDCGKVMQCPRCYVSLNYHSDGNTLLCHQCNYKMPAPRTCPECHSYRIKFMGLGTQKLEQETAFAFPRARILRWDSDSTKSKNAHQQILDKFSNHEADILIGTQMVAKGLDLPNVTLVGVVIADTGLNLPDFRAGERTFQLISQVAGRAGRGVPGGRVIIQTYMPQHYAIKAALNHNYAAFFKAEINYRMELGNPPFSKIIVMSFTNTSDILCRTEAGRMKKQLALEMESSGIYGISILGPSPAFIQRLRGRFRWQIILRGNNPDILLSKIQIPQGWTINVDPIGPL